MEGLKAIFTLSKNITPGGLNTAKKTAGASGNIAWESIMKGKNIKRFTIYHAYKLFGNISDPDYEVDKRVIDQCF